jgi:hypothetical protein
MVGREVVPALGLESFSCPHVNCGAIAHQTWFSLYVQRYGEGAAPWLPSEEFLEKYRRDKNADPAVLKFFENVTQGKVFLETHGQSANHATELINVHVSKCFSCGNISVWRADELIYPLNHVAVEPNEGMPPDVRADFLEANEILDKSPRGAAALLRLCVQKVLIHLGEKGKNINDEIGNLVQKGLDKRIQQALDVVRVVGNNAVHPGQIDLRDDKTTATKLFGLVNIIVESQITQTKHIEEMYDTVVPETIKAQIEQRDAPKQIENKKVAD